MHQNTIALGCCDVCGQFLLIFTWQIVKWHGSESDRLRTCTFNASALLHCTRASTRTHAHSQNTTYIIFDFAYDWLFHCSILIAALMHSHFNSSTFFSKFSFFYSLIKSQMHFLHKFRCQASARRTQAYTQLATMTMQRCSSQAHIQMEDL